MEQEICSFEGEAMIIPDRIVPQLPAKLEKEEEQIKLVFILVCFSWSSTKVEGR